jgi:hypothetical protein
MSIRVVNFGLPLGRALFMVKSSTMGNLHVAAITGGVVPSFTVNC